ncbi:MAG: PadR family transcriptional regulator [Leptospirales bacterium]|nr:PadR family transcriptional regulator [Leptospirales bacterium]
MSVKHIILGSLMKCPAHGYSLRSGLISKVLAEFGINDGQLYPILKKLTSEGLIKKVIEYRDKGPNRHNYYITEAGKEEFAQWLESHEDEKRAFRYEIIRKDIFLNKCMFLGFLDTDLSKEKIKRQIEETQNTTKDFKNAHADMKNRNFDLMDLMIVKYCIMNLEARLKWLIELQSELKARR